MVIEFPWWIYPILIWTLILKGVGAWKSARNNQLPWFISFFVFNTIGILPIVYLTWFQKDRSKKISKESKKKTVKKSRL